MVAVKSYYRKLWRREGDQQASPTVPNFHIKAVSALARQLGVPVDIVLCRFERTVRELIDGLLGE